MVNSTENVKPFLSRWSVPISGFLLTLMGGISYAWSVFVIPLQETFDWSRAEAVLPVSVYLFFFAVMGTLFGGYLQDKYGPRKIAVAGSLLLLLGYAMAAQINHFPYVWWLTLSYGVIAGMGCGFTYCVAVPSARKWFPDRPALAVAISVTGFGLAATFFAPWITRMIATTSIANTFLVLAVMTSVVSLIAAWLQRIPSEGWAPAGFNANINGTNGNKPDTTARQAFKSRFFYLQWICLFCLIFGGLMAMAHLVPYGVSTLGMERPAAAVAMIWFGLANGFGRTIAGFIADKVGALNVMLVSILISGIAFLLFNSLAITPMLLNIFALIFGWGFAATLGLMPAITTAAFGAKNLGAIYGALLTAFGLAALLGPMAAATAYDLTQNYILSFAGAGVLSLIGWSICLFAFKLKYKMR